MTWRGKPYQIPPKRQMETIRTIEQHLTRRQLMALMLDPDPKLGALAEVWSAVLRIAGAAATTEEAYQALAANADDETDFWAVPYVAACCDLLRVMLLPKQWADYRSTLEATLARIAAGEQPEEPAGPLVATPKPTHPRTRSPRTRLS
jgi:hypothetical protein